MHAEGDDFMELVKLETAGVDKDDITNSRTIHWQLLTRKERKTIIANLPRLTPNKPHLLQHSLHLESCYPSFLIFKGAKNEKIDSWATELSKMMLLCMPKENMDRRRYDEIVDPTCVDSVGCLLYLVLDSYQEHMMGSIVEQIQSPLASKYSCNSWGGTNTVVV